MIPPIWFGLFFAACEIAINLVLRAKRSSRVGDRGSYTLIWLVVPLSMMGSYLVPTSFPEADVADRMSFYWPGLALFIGGLALRWYAIVHLGRFFTVNIAVAADQRVVSDGPYRFLRHPSYTGALIAFLGLGLCLGNFASIAVSIVPTAAAFLYRIHVEEAALQSALGSAYADYMQRTKRLIPFVY
jgi:protein-S-isoprenylcysteine O-methyltransferase